MSAAPEPDLAAQRRARVLLALGAALGLALAGAGLMRGGTAPEGALPAGAVASVNGTPIRLEEFQRAVQALAADRRDPLVDADRRHVLDRLVDEELLVQRGLELGLARHDRRVRGDIVAAVIQSVVAESEANEPSDADLEAFYAESRDYFARSGRLTVRQILVRAEPVRTDEEARARAAEASARLRGGEAFLAVDEALGDPQVALLPADPLPLPTLREYIGPSAARAAAALAAGDVSEPVRGSAGYAVLVLVAREPGSVPPLAEVREEVRVEWRRRAGDTALRRYLDELRERADVRAADALP
jgi:parvulin-like peptidyl-prolyl isomerase